MSSFNGGTTPAGSTSVGSLTGRTRGTATPAANGALSSFAIPHGLGSIPSFYSVTPANALSLGVGYVTADNTNLTVFYSLAPAAGALSLKWVAEA